MSQKWDNRREIRFRGGNPIGLASWPIGFLRAIGDFWATGTGATAIEAALTFASLAFVISALGPRNLGSFGFAFRSLWLSRRTCFNTGNAFEVLCQDIGKPAMAVLRSSRASERGKP